MELEPTIAVRSLTHPETGAVPVEIGAPRPFDDGTGWYCPYRIGGSGKRVRFAGGVDAVQALQLVMTMIGADIAAMNEAVHGTMKWGESFRLGFP